MRRAAIDADLATIDRLAGVEPSLKRLLADVRVSLETVFLSALDREDVLDSFRRLTEELGRTMPDAERLMRYWNRINDLAPTAGHQLAESPAIRELSLQAGDSIQPRGGFLNEAAAAAFVQSVESPSIRRVLEEAHTAMKDLSLYEGRRPEGAFDLLYFYQLLAWWFRRAGSEETSPSPRPS